jgi:NAD(P)-dependent dehydrogenase (short-subunit alcohol dehydrogenase family)
MSVQPLLGKSALVTGGARRLGREIALTLARAGADLTITYSSSEAEAQETASAIGLLGHRAQVLRCDVRNENSVRETVAAAQAFHGRLDLLVNNAGVFTSASLNELSVEMWDEAFATNTRGPFLMAREALPWLRSAEGRIINIGSLGGSRAWATHGHYCASKAALHSLTQSMAKAFAPTVSVNCVAPGWIEMEREQGSELAAHFAARTPMRRNGSASDIAEAVLFFATGPHFITGQILGVDGGLGL